MFPTGDESPCDWATQSSPQHSCDRLLSVFERTPSVSDFQAAWLLLLCCAGTRAHYLLRALPSHATEKYAAEHDGSERRCLGRLLESDIPDPSWEVANLPFSMGGLGLRNGSRISAAAYWASWADCLHTVQTRHPVLGAQISAAMSQGGIGQHMEAAARCRERLSDVGVEAPPLKMSRVEQPRQNALYDAEPGDPEGRMLPLDRGNVAANVRFVSSPSPFPGLGCRSLVFPRRCVPFRLPTVPHSSLASPLAPFALFCSQLFLWPSPCRLRSGRCSGAEEGSQSKLRQHVCVVKLEPESP